MIHLQQN